MKRTARIVLFFLLAGFLLVGCQFTRPGASSTNNAVMLTPSPFVSDTPLPTAAPTLTLVPTQTPVSVEMLAEKSAQDYFAALEKGDTTLAADQISQYSLMVFGLTHGDVAAALQKQKIAGAGWSGLNITGSKAFDAQTTLVHVTYTLKGKEKDEPRDEMWPFRLEGAAWHYNWNNLIDFRTLGTNAQALNGIVVKPLQMNRYSDHLDLILLAQNTTNSALVFGQVNETLATFGFGDQEVVAEKTQIILNPLRSVPDMTLTMKGLYPNFPDTVVIRKWKNYNVKPWYTFQLN